MPLAGNELRKVGDRFQLGVSGGNGEIRRCFEEAIFGGETEVCAGNVRECSPHRDYGEQVALYNFSALASEQFGAFVEPMD